MPSYCVAAVEATGDVLSCAEAGCTYGARGGAVAIIATKGLPSRRDMADAIVAGFRRVSNAGGVGGRPHRHLAARRCPGYGARP